MSADHNGGKTGWPPGLLQDDSKQLSKWLSTHGCARALAREAADSTERKRMMQITIYTKSSGCANCTAAKQLLKSKGLAFDEHDIDDPEEREHFTTANPGIRQMPQIWINGQRVGGLEGLKAALTQLGL